MDSATNATNARPVRTRYAPSPTGFQHIGGLRTALYCYLFTRKMGGQFLLRIEDTDRSRYVPGAEEYIIESLSWLGIECDEGVHIGGPKGPYRQSDRKALYAEYVQRLLDNGWAYYAFDTPEELTAMREEYKTAENPSPQYNAFTRRHMRNSLTLSDEEVTTLLGEGVNHVVRFKIPADQTVVVNDVVRGEVVVNSNELDDKVLMKSDGMPTYHLANVVDDRLMGITHVIRGEEWLPSTPLHVLLYRAFGWEDEKPSFAHLPLLMKPDGKGKLSKRDGDRLGFPVFPLAWVHPLKEESSSGYREIGFLPEAFTNVLAFLGWNPGTEQEIFDNRADLVDAFSLERVSKSGAKFDYNKAKWFNEQYIKALTPAELAAKVRPFAPAEMADVSDERLTEICALLQERITLLPDVWEQGAYFFGMPQSYTRKVLKKKWKEDRKPHFQSLRDDLAALSDFSAEQVETTVKAMMERTGLGFGDVLQILRVMLVGVVSGPSIFEIAALLGQEETLKRMDYGFSNFDAILAEPAA